MWASTLSNKMLSGKLDWEGLMEEMSAQAIAEVKKAMLAERVPVATDQNYDLSTVVLSDSE